MYRLVLFLVVVSIVLSGCQALESSAKSHPIDQYPYMIITATSSIQTWYCKEFNELTRTGFNCERNVGLGEQHVSEFHLGSGDRWYKR